MVTHDPRGRDGGSLVRRASCWPALVLLGCFPGSPALAQALGDLGDPRFAHAVATRREEVLETSRRDVARRLLALAHAVARGPEGVTPLPVARLGEAQQLVDSVALLDGELVEAASEALEARRGLLRVLEDQVAALRRSADGADPQGRAALAEQIGDLEAEVRQLRAEDARAPAPHPLSPGASALSTLLRAVRAESARLGTLRSLQDELTIFMGWLRVFDETGLPPTVRAESGGASEPGCAITACSADMAATAGDLPLELFRPHGGSAGEGGQGADVTVASLLRLEERLLVHAGEPGGASPGPWRAQGPVTRETGVGLGLTSFRRHDEGRAGLGLKVGSALYLTRAVGTSTQLALEPWVGARSTHLETGSTAEVGAELRETLTGALGAGRVRWQATSWQKGRFLSDPLPPPGYLEPGRGEGGMVGRVAFFLRSPWAVEVGAGGDVVRYGPDDWSSLDRQGVQGSVALARHAASLSARMTFLASRHGFPHAGDSSRVDTRMGVGADGSLEGKVVVRLSAGVAWNDSRVSAYDFRSERAALVVSAPLGSGSVQGYGAFTHQSYRNPGPGEVSLGPSDEDTGTLLALQLTRPQGAGRARTWRVEWARSETGFGRESYQRLGASVQVAFRGLAGR